jgi:hypothetical protein
MPNTIADVDAALARLKGLALHDDESCQAGNAENPIQILDFDEISSIRRTPKKPQAFSFRILPKDEKPRTPLEAIALQSPAGTSSPAAFSSPITIASSIRTVSSVDSPRNRRIAPKRRVIYSSDEEEEVRPYVGSSPSTSLDGENKGPIGRIIGKKTLGKERRLFVDVEAKSSRGELPSEGEDGGYDTPGSLRDFVVDDSVVEYETDASRRDMHLHLRDPVEVSSDEEPWDRRQVGSAGPIVLSSDDDDDDDENRISGPSTSPIKTVLSAKAKREWNKIKHRLADNLVQELNENVFLGRLPEIPLEWSSRLLTTAGRAHRRRLQPGETLPQVRIELAEKILDDEGEQMYRPISCRVYRADALRWFLFVDRLNRTLAHELCHVATWIISGDLKNPHGANFKAWGSKVNRYRPDIVVTVNWESCNVMLTEADLDGSVAFVGRL